MHQEERVGKGEWVSLGAVLEKNPAADGKTLEELEIPVHFAREQQGKSIG